MYDEDRTAGGVKEGQGTTGVSGVPVPWVTLPHLPADSSFIGPNVADTWASDADLLQCQK